MLHPDRQIVGIDELRRKNGPRLRGPFCHTNVTVISLSLYRVVRTFALIRNAITRFPPAGFSANIRSATAFHVWRIGIARAETLSRRVDLRCAPGHAWLQRRSASGFSARE